MRVLVTGSAGFLGRHFVQAHLAKGDQVVGVDDLSAQDPVDVPGDVMDVTEVLDIERWCFEDLEMRIEADFDLAYHFAAPVGGRVKIEQDPLFNAHSLAIDSTFFRWAIDRASKVVYPSSSAVYGRALQSDTNAGALHEGAFSPQNPTWFAPDEMYGFTKLAGEMLAWKAATYGLDSLCIRPFSGYGEGQSFDYPVPSIAARALRREDPLIIWGSGDQSRDFIHVDDLVNATLARLDYPLKGYDTLNLGRGAATSFKTVAEILAQEIGYAPAIQTDESKPEGVKKRWADVGRMALYYQPSITLRQGLRRVLADVEKRLAVPA